MDMNMPQLNLPNAVLKTKLVEGTTQVFDAVRKKLVLSTVHSEPLGVAMFAFAKTFIQ